MSEENLKIADIIFAYVRGTITGGQFDELKAWLDASEKHRELFERMTMSDSYGCKKEVYARFDQYYNFDHVKALIRRKKRNVVLKYSAIAATILLPFLILFVMSRQFSPSESSTERIALVPGKPLAILVMSDGQERVLAQESDRMVDGTKRIVKQDNQLVYTLKDSVGAIREMYHEIKVPRGGEYQVTLSDGSHVWLNAGSSIRFPVEFKGECRRIWISGEAFLEVAKDERHPFIVRGGGIDVKVLGTKFNFRAYGEEKRMTTTLVEGRVQVDDSRGTVAVLKPSEQLLYNKESGEQEVRKVDTELFTSWKDGVYLFKSQRLEEIMGSISRWYDVDVFYLSPSAKDIVFSGRLKRYENAEGLLNVFEKLGGVRFTVQGRTVLVDIE